jgi:DNA-binding MarR family transcriptional regulator
MTYTPSGEAFTQLVLSVFRLNGLLLEAGDRMTAPLRQTSARWQVMGCIDDEARTVADVARMMGLARQSVQRIADLLVEDGLAVYSENPHHKRAKLIKLNTKGLKVLSTIEAAQRIWANKVGKEIGERELIKVNKVLEHLQQVLSNPSISSSHTK